MTAQIFKDIQGLLPILSEFTSNGNAQISIDQKLLLKQLAKDVLNVPNPNIACDSCVISYLHHLYSFNEREYPKFIEQQPKKTKKSK